MGRQFGLHADELNRGIAQLDCCRHAADHAPAAYWGENRFQLGQIFENLQSNRALASDDLLVVEGRHDYVAMLRGQFFALELALDPPGPDRTDFRAYSSRG